MSKKTLSRQQWREILCQRITEEIGNTNLDSVDLSVNIGADWLIKQYVSHSEMTNLCLEYISKHIIRWICLMSGKKDSIEKLEFLSSLADRLEEKGIEIEEISVRIFEILTGKEHRKRQNF